MRSRKKLSGKSTAFQLCRSVLEVEKAEYDSIQPADSPFFEFDFLLALEESGCVGPGTGWEPRHLLLREGGELAGAVTFYVKTDSYGEYIFDWQWAQAYHDAGLRYYPKAVVGVPFTPANGERILVSGEYDYGSCAGALVEKLADACADEGLSSIHFLFVTPREQETLGRAGFLPRLTHQYHWRNDGYSDFDDFLSALRSGKRKQIRKERRSVRENARVSVFEKDGVTRGHMDRIWDFYVNTNSRKWGNAYLNRKFFDMLYESWRERMVIVMAERDGRPAGGTINFRKGDKLYGRYWGARENVPYLHFECCYYSLIEFAIENGIRTFEAGAQGEHKFLRGFRAEEVRSSHLFFNRRAHEVVENFLRAERPYTRSLISRYNSHSPLKAVRGGKSEKII